MVSNSQIMFSEAKSNSKLKQIYLDHVMQSCPESVQGLVYDPEWSNRNAYMDRLVDENHLDGAEVEKTRPHMKDAYFLVIFPPSLLGASRKHPIFVSDNGFGKMKSEAHFLSSILDHEALHTDDLMYGMRLPNNILIDYTNIDELNPKIVINLREVIAYKNQLSKLPERGIYDPAFRGWLQWQLDDYEQTLHSVNPKSDLENKILGYK